MATITLPHNFTARAYQEDFFKSMNGGTKRAILVWHRRAGKDISAWNYLIYTAMEKKGIYYYVFPTFAQGRKVLWDGMTSDGTRFLDFLPKELIKAAYQQEMKIKLINGSMIQVVGSDNYDALMGTNPTGCIFSEYSLQDPNAWQYMRPILDVNGGWAIFVFTPRGSNHAKELYDNAVGNPDWFVQRLTVENTDVLDAAAIEKVRKEGMSEDMIQQEFYCSFTLGIQGSYYAKYLDQARKASRICAVPIDEHALVHTAWDIGVGDMMSITFFQCIGREIHIIDYYEHNGEGLPHYSRMLKDKKYNYGSHFAPHDIMQREMSSGHTRLDIARNLGIKFTVLKNNLLLEDGIELVRGMFSRFWIDESRCSFIIKALENYSKVYDDKNKVYQTKPKHNWASHCADSCRYMCMAIKSHIENEQGPSDEEVDRLMDRYNPRFS